MRRGAFEGAREVEKGALVLAALEVDETEDRARLDRAGLEDERLRDRLLGARIELDVARELGRLGVVAAQSDEELCAPHD